MADSVYENMSNPLDNPELLERIVNSYADRPSMYGALTKSNTTDKKIIGKYYPNEKDELFVKVFNDWKNSIISLVQRDQFLKEYKTYGKVLANYLQTLNPKTYQEVMKIMDYESITNEPLRTAMEKLRWDRVGEYSGWDQIHSAYINPAHKKQHIKHRLYINCDSTRIHKIAKRFIDKCNQHKLTYYFKFDDYSGRDDSIVFYSDTEHLNMYIRILREIYKEENLKDAVYSPPLCTSKIDNWIGYGTDPENMGHKTSFNDVRAKHLEECFNRVSHDWMQRNLNARFKLNGTPITYKEYLVRNILREARESYTQFAKDDEGYIKWRGYGKKDLETQEFTRLLYQYINTNFDQIMNYYKTGNYNLPETNFRNGKVKVSKDTFNKIRRQQIKFMYNNSHRFREDIIADIKATSSSHGIDPDNYGCDLYVKEELKKLPINFVSKKEAEKQQPTIPQPKPTIPQPKPTTPKQKPTTPESKVSNVDVSSKMKSDTTYTSWRRSKKGYNYKPMTAEEIEESRRKLGIK